MDTFLSPFVHICADDRDEQAQRGQEPDTRDEGCETQSSVPPSWMKLAAVWPAQICSLCHLFLG